MLHDMYRTPYLIEGAVQAILGAQTRSSVLDAEDAEGAARTARGAATDRGPDGSKLADIAGRATDPRYLGHGSRLLHGLEREMRPAEVPRHGACAPDASPKAGAWAGSCRPKPSESWLAGSNGEMVHEVGSGQVGWQDVRVGAEGEGDGVAGFGGRCSSGPCDGFVMGSFGQWGSSTPDGDTTFTVARRGREHGRAALLRSGRRGHGPPPAPSPPLRPGAWMGCPRSGPRRGNGAPSPPKSC